MSCERLVRAYIDIETTGLDPEADDLTVVGIAIEQDGELRLVQLYEGKLSRKSLLAALAGVDILYSWNGLRFDLPFIAERAIVHRVELPAPPSEIDLLHISRRLWKDYLPDCRLVTLEQHVCGRRRTGDIPSHLIPKAYHDYVESGDARLVADVIRHNAHDLVTMAHLLAKIANG